MDEHYHELNLRVALLEQSYLTVSKQLGAINSNLTKLVWVILTAFVLSGVGWVINGGLSPKFHPVQVAEKAE